MKTSLILLAALFSVNSFATEIKAKATISQRVVFEYQSKKSVQKIYSTFTADIKSMRDGVVERDDQNITLGMDKSNDLDFIMIDKKTLHVEDRADGISGQIPAKIKTKFGKMVKLTIEGDVYENLYDKQLKALGLKLFGDHSATQSGITQKLSLNLSDLNCKKVDDELVCDQSIEFKFYFSDEFRGKEEITSLFNNALKVIDSYLAGVENISYSPAAVNSVLQEISDELSTEGFKSDFDQSRRDVQKILDYLFNERLDNYNYRTISGGSAKNTLLEIKDAIKTSLGRL